MVVGLIVLAANTNVPSVTRAPGEILPQGNYSQVETLEGGIVDSMGLLEIVNFLESELEIILTDEEILADNFESIDRIAEFVKNRKNVPSN